MISLHSHKSYTVVIDIGFHRSHIGLSGEESPQCSTYSRLFLDKSLMDKTYGVGDFQLQEQRTNLEIHKIIQDNSSVYQGTIFKNQQFMQFIERTLLDKLKLSSENISILFTEDINLSSENDIIKQRQKMCEIMFQQFNIFNVCFMKKPVLSALSVAKNNCVVVDSGHLGTRVSIVQDGYAVLTKCVGYGGQTIDAIISEITGDISLPIQKSAEPYQQSFIQFQKRILRQSIKHTFPSEIVNLFDHKNKMNIQSSQKISYNLPDGNSIDISRSQICDPFVNYPEYYKKYLNFSEDQAIFATHIDSKSIPSYRSLATFILETINQFLNLQYPANHSQHDIVRNSLIKNIVFTGGNMLFSDLSNKLYASLKLKQPDCLITIPPIYSEGKGSYNSSPFVGGSLVSDLPIFNKYWIGQSQWKQAGNKMSNDAVQGQSSMVINLSQVSKNIDTNSIKAARNNLISKKCP